MFNLRTLSCALGALLFATVAIAEGPTPAQVAQQCAQQIGQTAQNTIQVIQNRTQVGVARINHLDAEGAPAPVIFASAQASRLAINTAAHHGARSINQTAGFCLWVLDQMDAPPPPRQLVITARENALHAIGGAREMGLFILGEALMNAVGEPGAVEAF